MVLILYHIVDSSKGSSQHVCKGGSYNSQRSFHLYSCAEKSQLLQPNAN